MSRRGHWLAAVLACGNGAVLSHRSAAALWGLMSAGGSLEVTAQRGRRRPGIAVHEGKLAPEDRAEVDAIPVTAVACTLFDLAEIVDGDRLRRAFEEADRLRLLELRAVEHLCEHSHGRRGLGPVSRLVAEARAPVITRSPLEEDFAELCRRHDLPPPNLNVEVIGREVDALWPRERLIVELDGWAFHRHRGAFERDRSRDATLQAAGYRVIRITHRRLVTEPASVADQVRQLLGRA